MPYKNVKVSKLAKDVSIERTGNGYVVRPEFAGVGYDEKNDHNRVFSSVKEALKAAEVMLTEGITAHEEKWVPEAEDRPRRAKAY